MHFTGNILRLFNQKNNYRLLIECYCGVFLRRGTRHGASNIPEQGRTRRCFRADSFAPVNLAYRLAYLWLAYRRMRFKRIKLRQSLRHATSHDKLGANPKFWAHHQCDHLL